MYNGGAFDRCGGDRARDTQDVQPFPKVFVGNLSINTDNHMLRKHFETCGDVKEAEVLCFFPQPT